MNPELLMIIEQLRALQDESDVSKKFKEKTGRVISILTGQSQLAVEKALLELEELNSAEVSPYHRTQIWDIISLLECMKN